MVWQGNSGQDEAEIMYNRFTAYMTSVIQRHRAAQGYRKLVLNQTYVAIYKIIGNTVYIYRIVNGKTDYPRLLK